MLILDYSIDNNNISLSTDVSMDRLLLQYSETLNITYSMNSINNTTVNISAADLELDSLKNIFFKIEVLDALDNKASQGLYTIDIVNDLKDKLYSANTLKQELDNLNYYDGIVDSLIEKQDYLTANDMFNNFINFLEKELNGNNFSTSVSGQSIAGSCNN